MQHVTLKLSQVLPNPFRDLEAIPLDTKNVEALRDSIRETGFWSGLQVRKQNGNYELVFGHNRLQAAKDELGSHADYEFDLVDADDQEMIRRMNFENLQDIVQPTLGHLKIGVRAARDQIVDLMQSVASRDATDVSELLPYFTDVSNAKAALKSGTVTDSAICRYLYGGTNRRKSIERVLNQLPLTDWQIERQKAQLEDVGASMLDPKVMEQVKQKLAYNTDASDAFSRAAHAEAFRKAVVTPEAREVLTKEDQKELAERIAQELVQVSGGTQPPVPGQTRSGSQVKPEDRLNEANITRIVEDTVAALRGINVHTVALNRKAAAYHKKVEAFSKTLRNLADNLDGDMGTLASDEMRDLRIQLGWLRKIIAERGSTLFGVSEPVAFLGNDDIIEGKVING